MENDINKEEILKQVASLDDKLSKVLAPIKVDEVRAKKNAHWFALLFPEAMTKLTNSIAYTKEEKLKLLTVLDNTKPDDLRRMHTMIKI